MSEAPFAVASIKVLADPLPGLPLPQLVLIERGRPPDELPVPRHTSRQDRDAVIGSVERLLVRHRPLTREVAEGRVIVSDAVGILLEHLPANLHVIQYFRFAEYAQTGLPATWYLPRPQPCESGQPLKSSLTYAPSGCGLA